MVDIQAQNLERFRVLFVVYFNKLQKIHKLCLSFTPSTPLLTAPSPNKSIVTQLIVS
jgi:hypothetical protein